MLEGEVIKMFARFLVLAAVVTPATTIAVNSQTARAQNGSALMKVRHTHIWVQDVDRTKAFYRDKLGFKVSAERPGQNVEFEGGRLWFGKWRGSGTLGTNAITVGIAANSVEAAYQTLKQRGVSIHNPPSQVRDEWHFTFRDPDGYEVEIEGPK